MSNVKGNSAVCIFVRMDIRETKVICHSQLSFKNSAFYYMMGKKRNQCVDMSRNHLSQQPYIPQL